MRMISDHVTKKCSDLSRRLDWNFFFVGGGGGGGGVPPKFEH